MITRKSLADDLGSETAGRGHELRTVVGIGIAVVAGFVLLSLVLELAGLHIG